MMNARRKIECLQMIMAATKMHKTLLKARVSHLAIDALFPNFRNKEDV